MARSTEKKPQTVVVKKPTTHAPDAAAQLIAFDRAPHFAVIDGLVRIGLTRQILTLDEEGHTAGHYISAGQIVCSPAAAQHLRDALDKALLLGSKPLGSRN